MKRLRRDPWPRQILRVIRAWTSRGWKLVYEDGNGKPTPRAHVRVGRDGFITGPTFGS